MTDAKTKKRWLSDRAKFIIGEIICWAVILLVIGGQITLFILQLGDWINLPLWIVFAPAIVVGGIVLAFLSYMGFMFMWHWGGNSYWW